MSQARIAKQYGIPTVLIKTRDSEIRKAISLAQSYLEKRHGLDVRQRVVEAFPYWYSIPAQIKGVIDRLYSLVVGGKDIAGKECALIACCEEEDRSVLDGVRIPMERTAALNKWKMVGEVLIPGVLNVGDIHKTDGCAQAAALADRI